MSWFLFYAHCKFSFQSLQGTYNRVTWVCCLYKNKPAFPTTRVVVTWRQEDKRWSQSAERPCYPSIDQLASFFSIVSLTSFLFSPFTCPAFFAFSFSPVHFYLRNKISLLTLLCSLTTSLPFQLRFAPSTSSTNSFFYSLSDVCSGCVATRLLD